MSIKDVKTKNIVINLDKERHLRFDLNALEELEEMYGSFEKAMEELQKGKIKAIKNMLWAGLVHEEKGLTAKQVGSFVTIENMAEVMGQITKAIISGLPEVDKADEVDKSIKKRVSPSNDGWDWAWLLYMGTVLLNMSEEAFWKCTLRKLMALWKVHKKYNEPQREEDKEGYIDDVF